MTIEAARPVDRETVTRVPAASLWLGLAGLIPFIALGTASIVTDEAQSAQAANALAAYGAVILSFLGGIHWGLAIAGFGPGSSGTQARKGVSWRRLIVSVLPSLVGWVALLLPPASGLLMLAAGFVSMLALDWQATRAAEAPSWYPRLRWPLTGAVIVCLIASAAS